MLEPVQIAVWNALDGAPVFAVAVQESLAGL